MLADLCREEGDGVTVNHENPEGPPYYGITCEGEWTDWSGVDFQGNTMLEVLRLACATRTKRETCEHEWKDARNEVVTSGEFCRKCHMIRAGNRESDR